MATKYVLIDFENVQPKALDLLQPGSVRIKVFLGQQQTRLMLELVQALQRFGSDAQYVPIQGSGPDAVDFHIAFYIGRLSVDDPGAQFTIISKDKGFDPLVRHLTGLGIICQRLPDLPGSTAATAAVLKQPVAKKAAKKVAKKAVTAAQKPVAKKAQPKKTIVTFSPEKPVKTVALSNVPTARAQEVLALLKKSTKPSKLSGLRASITSWLNPKLSEDALVAIIQELQGMKKIVIDGTKVVYAL